jgi:CDP-diacylglycerol--glycerol-3-phosphate 3-phosphatidyltransferase
MKLSDFYTSLRIVLAPLFFILFFFPQWTGLGNAVSIYVLVPLFIFMEFTDYLDGYYARKQNQVTSFGKLYDPFADVLANLTVLYCFVLSGYLPSVLFLIILYREMGILFLRMMAVGKGFAIGARKGGKAKTVLYIVASGFSLAIESSLRLKFDLGSVLPVLRAVNLSLYVLAVFISAASFIDYLVHFSVLIKDSGKSK